MLASGPGAACCCAAAVPPRQSAVKAATSPHLPMPVILPAGVPRAGLYHPQALGEPEVAMSRGRTMSAELAERFADIALGHVGREYPAKLDQVLTGDGDLTSPRALHPIFYGSFDWHSCVHSHWLLARVLRRWPGVASAPAIRAWLDGAFTEAKVAGELAFLARPSAAGFERPYGWAWLVMLQAELEAHETDDGRRWAATLRPLTRAF